MKINALILVIIFMLFLYVNLDAGLVGRNGTGKTTFLRYMAMHAIDGIPKNCQILHVEQEVVGDDTLALQCVLNSDVERIQLLEEESRLLGLQVEILHFKWQKCKSDYFNLFLETYVYLFPFISLMFEIF